ncbi:hypothetical protein Tco_0788364, partial [Tanacetum coccineum]
ANQVRPFQRNDARGDVGTGNAGGQNRVGNLNPILDEEQLLFLAGDQVTNFDDVDDPPEEDLALNVDHVFEVDQVDAFDSDVDEAPTAQTMFMENLTYEHPIYDEARPSYDSDISCEVQDHDNYTNFDDEYHGVHKMQHDVQQNYVVNSNADHYRVTSFVSVPYDQYVVENAKLAFMYNHARPVVHDSEDTREIAEITRKRMLLKMQSPLCVENKVKIAPPNYLKENFAPQRDLTPEQIFWSIDVNDRKKAETSVPKPLSALTVYPPNTPVKLVPRVLPTKSQVKINLYYQHPSRKFDNNKSQASQEAQDLTHSLKIKNLATSDSREKEQTALCPQESQKDIKGFVAFIPLTRKKQVTSTNNTQKHGVHQKALNSSISRDRQIEKPKGKLSDNSLNKTKQIWQPKGKLFDNSLKKTKQVWKATGKLFANVGYQWRPTGKKFTSGKLNCGINGSPDRKIGKGNLLLDLQKLQKNPIFRISVDIRQNTNFVRAFTTSANVPSIYIQLFWNTLTHDVKTRVYSFQVNEHWLTLSADLLRKALNVTPADSAHPMRRHSSWIKTTGPSVHLEDATYTKMVRETLSHADAESGGLLINILESEEVESTCKLDEYKLDQTPEQVMWLLLDQTLSTCMMSSLLLFTLRILEESWWEADV